MYASIDNLKALTGELDLIQLSDRADPPTGEIDEAVVTGALAAASNLIDGYVGAQYALPLAEVPALLTDLACDVARFRLYREAPPEEVRLRYREAIKSLENIAKGVIALPVAGGAGGSVEPAGRDDVMVIQSEERIFSRSSMRGL